MRSGKNCDVEKNEIKDQKRIVDMESRLTPK